MKSRSKIHRPRLLVLFLSELKLLSDHEPTQYQSKGTNKNTGKNETHSGSPGQK